MKRAFCLIAGLLVAGCGDASEGGPSGASAKLPQPGQYQIATLREVIGSPEPMKEEASERCVTKSDMAKFHAAFAGNPDVPASCEPSDKDVGDGYFSVRMTCDTPDGDLTNLAAEIRGTYSSDEFEIVEDVTVVGVSQRSTKRYRRVEDC